MTEFAFSGAICEEITTGCLPLCVTMTIRDATNYCSACQEVCFHHPTHCTVCGTALEAAPLSDRNNSSINGERAGSRNDRIDISPIPQELRDETRAADRALRAVLQNIRSQIQQTGQDQEDLLSQLQNMRQEWEAIPDALLDPHLGSSNSSSRPTSKAYLEKIPRIVLREHSSLLYQASLKIDGLPQMEGILGDFDMDIKPSTQTGCLVIANPRTGLGGLSSETQKLMSEQVNGDGKTTFLCFERGDGVTFVQKAFFAQGSGAAACIIGNHLSEPWPYVMKDPRGEVSQNGGLRIPTVMIKKSDFACICNLDKQKAHSTCLEISQPSRDCVVCTESLTSGSKVLRLPACGHLFHEHCVLQWLNKHNTCPFCRHELPTDDEEYEQERRRAQRTHAGSSRGTNTATYSDFYG